MFGGWLGGLESTRSLNGGAGTDGENRRSSDAIERAATVSLALIIAVKPPRRPLAPFSRLNRPPSRDRQ